MMSIQTGYVVLDDETRQLLSDIIAKTVSEKLGKLRNQGVVVKKGVQSIPKFGGQDVKGWLYKCEEFFRIDNVPDERKVSLISNHLFDLALWWHKQFIQFLGEDVEWHMYKAAILKRFDVGYDDTSGVVPRYKNVADSSLPSRPVDKLKELLVNNSHCEENLEQSECAHKLFDEMPIKETLKQDTIADYCDAFVEESVEVEQGLDDDVVVESVKEPVEWENEVIDGDNVIDGSNGSLVRRIKGFNLLGMYVNKRYVEGCEDEDEDLNVFDFDCEVYNRSNKALFGRNEFFTNQNQEENDTNGIKACIVMRKNDTELGDTTYTESIEKATAIKAIDVLNSVSMESTKDGQVGVDILWSYELGLLNTKDTLLLGLHGCLNCSDRFSFSLGFVYTATTIAVFILAATVAFDPGGKRVCDLGGSHGRNVSGNQGIEIDCKSQILVVVTLYVWVEKSLLKSEEYEFGSAGKQVPAAISIQGMGGNELVLNGTFMGIVDKVTDKWFQISTFMETQAEKLRIILFMRSYGYQIGLKTLLLEKVLGNSKGIQRPVRYKVRTGTKGNEFVLEKVHDQCTLSRLNLVARHGTCASAIKGSSGMDVIHKLHVAKWFLDQLGKFLMEKLLKFTTDQFICVKFDMWKWELFTWWLYQTAQDCEEREILQSLNHDDLGSDEFNQQRKRSLNGMVIDSLVGSGLRERNTWRKVPQLLLMLEDKHHFKRDGLSWVISGVNKVKEVKLKSQTSHLVIHFPLYKYPNHLFISVS